MVAASPPVAAGSAAAGGSSSSEPEAMVTTTSASLGPRRTLLERNSVPEFLEQEAQAMLRRIDRVKPFVLQETMLPAAAPFPATLSAIERHLMADRRIPPAQVEDFARWSRAVRERSTA